jgi:NADH dehydrogenase
VEVLLAGATGFVGRHVAVALLHAGHVVRALVRPASYKVAAQRRREVDELVRAGCTTVVGDATEPADVERAASGVGAVVNLIGISVERSPVTFEVAHIEATANLVRAAEIGGARRFVQISGIGASPEARSRYHQTKAAGEAAVRASRLDWTILRPSVVVGAGDGFTNKVVDLVEMPLVAPIPGDGRTPLQPVAARDVGRAVAATLGDARTVGQAIDLVGPQTYTFRQVVQIVGAATGNNHPILPVPTLFLHAVAYVAEAFATNPIITSDQLRMMDGISIVDHAPVRAFFDWEWTPFEVALQETLAARREGLRSASLGQDERGGEL